MHIPLWIISASWTVLIGYWLISAFFVKKDVRGRSWQKLAGFRITLALAIAGALAYSGILGEVHIATYRTSLPLLSLGAVLTLLGVALAIYARVYLGSNWSGVPTLKVGHELVTSGPYRLVRNPIYTGILLALIGTSLALPPWTVMLVIMTALFVRRVFVEDALMRKQFPETYPAYRAQTWALIPLVW